MSKDKPGIIEKSSSDTAHTLAKAGLSAVPIFGGAAAEIFQMLVQPPLERRRQIWMREVGARLKTLEDEGFKLEQLQNDERFISTVLHASNLALRTHQEEKRKALRNAIINVAKGQSPEEAVEFMFLEYIDSLSVLHIKILRFLQERSPSMNINIRRNLLGQNIPELVGQEGLYHRFREDLALKGLIIKNGGRGKLSEHKRTTWLGDEFLAFISER